MNGGEGGVNDGKMLLSNFTKAGQMVLQKVCLEIAHKKYMCYIICQNHGKAIL